MSTTAPPPSAPSALATEPSLLAALARHIYAGHPPNELEKMRIVEMAPGILLMHYPDNRTGTHVAFFWTEKWAPAVAPSVAKATELRDGLSSWLMQLPFAHKMMSRGWHSMFMVNDGFEPAPPAPDVVPADQCPFMDAKSFVRTYRE